MMECWHAECPRTIYNEMLLSMEGTYFPWSSTAILCAQSCLDRGSCSIVLGSCHDLREAFTTSSTLGVQRMKGGDVLKFLIVGILWAGMDLDFHMEHYIYKRKSDNVLHHKSEENPREASVGSLCHCSHEKPGWCQCHFLQEYWPESWADVCCHL